MPFILSNMNTLLYLRIKVLAGQKLPCFSQQPETGNQPVRFLPPASSRMKAIPGIHNQRSARDNILFSGGIK
jgi:hypothetical protein